MGPMLGPIVGGLKMKKKIIRMFQYIKRNNLRRGDSPNNDFGFLADQLTYHELSSRLWIFSTLDSATIFRKSVMFTHRFQYSALEFNFENSSTQVPSITGGKPLVIYGGQPAISLRHRQFCVERNSSGLLH